MRHFALILLLLPSMMFFKPREPFKVKLIDYSIEKIPADCGVIAFATTLKFEALENVDSLRKGQNILVIITCPRELGIENYVNNHEYYLTIYGNSKADRKSTKEYAWTIFYEYKNETLPRLWCKELQIIK